MLDALLCLFVLAVGSVAVPALLWQSYGLDKRWAAFMASRAALRESFPNAGNTRSYAGNGLMERGGTGDAELVPDLVELLTDLDDDALLEVLARLPGPVDGYRFADSRLAKFAGGRVEDRLAQVRAVRGKDAPLPKGRHLVVRHAGQERKIAW